MLVEMSINVDMISCGFLYDSLLALVVIVVAFGRISPNMFIECPIDSGRISNGIG